MQGDAYGSWQNTQKAELTRAEKRARRQTKGPARTPARMGDKPLKAYVTRMIDEEWLSVDEIPTPPGRRARNVRRLAERMGLTSSSSGGDK